MERSPQNKITGQRCLHHPAGKIANKYCQEAFHRGEIRLFACGVNLKHFFKNKGQ